MPGLARKVGDIVSFSGVLPIHDNFRPSLEGVIVELKPEMGGYVVEAPNGRRFYMGHMEFEFTGRNVTTRYEREVEANGP